ncbi:glutathione peroxidase [Rhodobacteraceae bacterium NNCM2]|nr:glutathione peroxidase [Coraliihabitans acroporae]
MLTRRIFIAGAALAPLAARAAAITAHEFQFTDIDGNPMPLADFAGRPLMVVNTASRCGFTYQYDGLQALYDRYRERGFVLIGVPSDDFGGQELASEAEVKEFCAVNFALDFPLTEITRVKGPKAHPFYAWARTELGADQAPSWNFHKYLIAPDGRLVGAFGTRTEPTSDQVTEAVEALLGAA